MRWFAPGTEPDYPAGTFDPLGEYPTCVADPGIPASDPELIALRYLQQIPLPVPDPKIAPGWAITGKLAYLETRGQTSFSYSADTPVGRLEIAATGRYEVAWGDGETTGPYSIEGRPWPDGQITHDYVWSGTYDIVVSERWTASWTLGGRSGTIGGLRTTGRIDDFSARQIQAVIRSVATR